MIYKYLLQLYTKSFGERRKQIMCKRALWNNPLYESHNRLSLGQPDSNRQLTYTTLLYHYQNIGFGVRAIICNA